MRTNKPRDTKLDGIAFSGLAPLGFMRNLSGKTFRKLPEDLQAAVLKAGAEAGAFGRELESREDGIKLHEMIDVHQIKVQEFENRDQLLEMVKPVQAA